VTDGVCYTATLAVPAPYPSTMVQPDSEGSYKTFTWIVDADVPTRDFDYS